MRLTMFLAGGLIVVAGVALVFWPSEPNVRRFCRDARIGLPVKELPDLAEKYRLRLTSRNSRDAARDYWFVAHSWLTTGGGHTCLIRHNDVVVIESQYAYVD
jgi:hypothetical protein